MLFNSFNFLVFFPIVTIIYYVLGSGGNRMSRIWLLLASYYFYMCMKPIFGLLLLVVTVITYFCGRYLESHFSEVKSKQKALVISLVLVFGFLFVFKYFNFFNNSIEALLRVMGLSWNVPYLKILLPVGISFYTFQTAGYIIDVYRGTIKAEKDPLSYALFVSFFPVILAGPIQRAKNLIPQLKERHDIQVDKIIPGLKMMIWGYFMKLCVADRLGIYVDAVFNNVEQHNGISILIASIFYSFQIYGDFGGYSLVALGCAKTMGFSLPDNFKRPYFSESFKEFWRRWHIGLSSWFGDYLYISLGGNRVQYWRYLLNLMTVFVVSGLWHGAAWTFVLWGALHGFFRIIEALLTKLQFGKQKVLFGRFNKDLMRIIVFVLTTFAWIFFRSSTIDNAFISIHKIFSDFGLPFLSPMTMLFGGISLMILFIKDYTNEFHPKCHLFNSKNKFVASITTSLLIVYIVLFGVFDNSQFIYFQF